MQNQLNNFRNYFMSSSNSYKGINSVLFGGIIGSLFSFLQFVSSSFMGALSDYYGRKPILIISMVRNKWLILLLFIRSNQYFI